MGDEISKANYDAEDFRLFQQRLDLETDFVRQLFAEKRFDNQRCRVGYELELCLLAKDLVPVRIRIGHLARQFLLQRVNSPLFESLDQRIDRLLRRDVALETLAIERDLTQPDPCIFVQLLLQREDIGHASIVGPGGIPAPAASESNAFPARAQPEQPGPVRVKRTRSAER